MAHGIDLKRLSTPGNPASTHDRLYNDANGTLYLRDSNGVQNQISPASGSFTSFTMSDGSNNQTINSGNTQTFTGGVAINGTVAATDTLTLNWNLTKLSSASGTLHRDDYLGLYDLSGVTHQRIALSDLPISTSVDTSNDYVPVIKNSNGLLYRVAPTNLGSSGANTALSNLASVAINTSLISDTDNTDDLGSSATKWRAGYMNALYLEEGSAPSTPSSGDFVLYSKVSGAGQLFAKNDSGTEKQVTDAYAILRDEKTSGTNGGASSAATWNARDLNTEVTDTDAIVSIASNQFTPIAGTYDIDVIAPSHNSTGVTRLRLYNVTAAAVVDYGHSDRNVSTTESISELHTRFTANGTDAYRIDHYTGNAVATNGLGFPASIASVNEIYTEVRLRKVA